MNSLGVPYTRQTLFIRQTMYQTILGMDWETALGIDYTVLYQTPYNK